MGAEPVTIDYNGVGCLVAGQHPKLSACFARRLEGILTGGNLRLGTWPFEAHDEKAGTLRVMAGEVQSVAGNAIAFRLRGVSGERVAFTFRRPD